MQKQVSSYRLQVTGFKFRVKKENTKYKDKMQVASCELRNEIQGKVQDKKISFGLQVSGCE